MRPVRVQQLPLVIFFSAVIPPYVPHLSTLVRLAGFRLIEAGLPENLDVDCQPSLSMHCGLEIERSAVPAGLVHMLQLASKTGATLAGKRVPLSQEQVPRSYITHV